MTYTTTAIKELTLGGNYYDFETFYIDHKTEIYTSLISLFSQFIEVNVSQITLTVSAKIQDMDWSTDLTFTRKDFNVLPRDIMPHFESLENYEMCNTIKNLYSRLLS